MRVYGSKILPNSDYYTFQRRHQNSFRKALSLWAENAVSDKVTLADSILRVLFNNSDFSATKDSKRETI